MSQPILTFWSLCPQKQRKQGFVPGRAHLPLLWSCSIPSVAAIPRAGMAPVAAPPPHFPQQPTATQFLLLIQPQTCLWTMAAHQHRIQPNSAAWRNCWTRHSSQRRHQSLAQLTQALQAPKASGFPLPGGFSQSRALCGCWKKHLQEPGGFVQRLSQPSVLVKLGFTNRSAFSRHEDGRENHLPSLDAKRRGFQQDTWLQDSADCLFLWHTLSAQRRHGCPDPNVGVLVKHPYQPTPGTLLPTHLLPTTPTRGLRDSTLLSLQMGEVLGVAEANPEPGSCPVCGHSLLLCTRPALSRQQSPSPGQG